MEIVLRDRSFAERNIFLQLMRLRSFLILGITIGLIVAGVFFASKYYQAHRTDDEIWMVPEDALLVAKCSSLNHSVDSIKTFQELQTGLGDILRNVPVRVEEYYYSIHPDGNWVVYVSDHQIEFDDFSLEESGGMLTGDLKHVCYENIHGHHVFTTNEIYLQQIEEQLDTKSLTFPNHSEEPVLITFRKGNLLDGCELDSSVAFGLNQVLPKGGSFSALIKSSEVRFNGSSEDLENYALLSSGQEALDFRLYYLMSNAAKQVLFFSLTDGVAFRDQFRKYDFKRDNKYSKEKELLTKEFGVNLDDFYYLIAGQVGITSFQLDGETENVCLIPLADEVKMRAHLLSMMDKVSGDSLVFDTHNGYSIYNLEIAGFPELLFGEAASGFLNSKIAFYDDYLIVASSAKGLRKMLIDIEDDNIWGRTIEENIKIDKFLTSCTAGYYVPNLKGANSEYLQGYDLLALQISSEGDDGFFNGALAKVGSNSNAIPVEEIEVVADAGTEQKKVLVEFKEEITSKPYLVLNHATNKHDIIVQTADDTLRNVTNEGEVNWAVKLAGTIIGDVQQVDLFKNGKVQYLITTSSKVYCLDRLGRMVENFPFIPPSGGVINGCSIVDYDHSKNYRFLVTTDKGEVFMYNKEGQALKGWKPNVKLGSSTNPTASHVRVKGKDYLYALNNAGELFVFRRSAETVPHFPYKVGNSTQGVFVERGADFSSTYFTTMNTANQLVKVNLYGDEILKRKLLGIQNARIVPFVGKNNFVISAQKGKDLVVFDRDGEVKGVVPNGGVNHSLQAYVLESGKFYFLRNDAGGGKFFNKEFIELQDVGLVSQDVALLSKGNGQYKVYKVNRTSLEMSELQIK